MALEIKPRLPHNYVVRRAKVNKTWCKEEVACPLPFTLKRGFEFTVEVLITEPGFMVSFNGRHFCTFTHRLPYRHIQTLEVIGHIREVSVGRMIVECYPIRSLQPTPKEIVLGGSLQPTYEDENGMESRPSRTTLGRISWSSHASYRMSRTYDETIPIPFYGVLDPSSFSIGRVLKIEGRVKLLPQSFYINLQNGQDVWPHPIIALHLNTRFTKQHTGAIGRATLVRNAWKDGAWGVEELSELVTQLRPGKAFSLCIVNNPKSFDIYVNHQFMANFKYRMPSSVVNTVYIQGDIKLWDVTLEQCLSFDKLHTKEKKRSTNIRAIS